MEWVRGGGKVEATDKAYKFYIDPPAGSTDGGAKFYTVHLSEEQAWEFWTLWKEMKINWGYPPYTRIHLPGVAERIDAEAAGSPST